MKKVLLVISLIIGAHQSLSAQCNCRANIVVGMEYLNSQYSTIAGGVPLFTPATLATAAAVGNMISIYLYNAPCPPSPSEPCYGRLKAALTKGDGTAVSPLYSGGDWSAGYSRVIIPVSALTPGVNEFRVIAECNNGSNTPTQCTVINSPRVLVSGGAQPRSCVNAVITPICDSRTTVTPGNPHTFRNYTGEISFKIEASVPAGCAAPVYIKLTRPGGLSETKSYNSLTHIPANYPFNTGANGTYTIDFLDIFNNVIHSYSYKKTRMSCMGRATNRNRPLTTSPL
jgi:hypothetical protein